MRFLVKIEIYFLQFEQLYSINACVYITSAASIVSCEKLPQAVTATLGISIYVYLRGLETIQ